jgi:hypothetical protein
VTRHPKQPNYWADIDAAWEAMIEGKFPNNQTWSTAAGMSIIGMSGMGKTMTVERILNTYPQIIYHSRYKDEPFTQTQVVWLKLECPYDGEPKSVCINFFQMMDKILGTSYREEFAKDFRTAKVMLPDMANLAAQLALGILVIDEIQRLSYSRSGGAGKLLEFFCQLINMIGVPVLTIGTFKSQRILTKEVRQIRRGTGQGDMLWYPMKEDKVWKHFIDSLWKYQYTRNVCALTNELRAALFSVSQGITDFAVKVYMLAQIRAITSKEEVINVDIIESVARDSLKTAEHFLRALRTNDIRALAQYEDVPKIDFEEIIKQELEREALGLEVNGNNSHASRASNGEEVALDSQQGLKNEDAASTAEQKSQQIVAPAKARKSSKKLNTTGASTPKGFLPKIVMEQTTKHGISPYDVLKRSGFIRNSEEFLLSK